MRRSSLLPSFLLAFALLLPTGNATAHSTSSSAYVESALLTAHGTVAVIVSATNAQTAAAAVAQVGGSVTSELWLIDAVAARVPAAAINRLAGMTGITSVVANTSVASSNGEGWVTDRDLPSSWDGRPDVQTTSDPTVYRIVNPVTIDIGADVLHETYSRRTGYINGSGVTVAVVDSGVYFDNQVRQQLGQVVQRNFLGQADFVASTCRTETVNGKTRTVGVQQDGFCLVDHRDTADGYGHGTAVASIIWNNFKDANTGVMLGVAPQANILSVRVLNNDGVGSYESVIKGIQFTVENRRRYDVKVMNLSISATPSTPYFVDPLNRAVERAWSKGVVVVVAAGNDGPRAETVTVPGNDPYVITVGAVDSNRTPGYWTDDVMPTWSAAGPTHDGFVKPDLVAPGANIITFMHNNPTNPSLSQKIVRMHPDYSATTSLFRMSGTSMATAVASGVTALLLQANPKLTPDQVKYRLMFTARPAAVGDPSALVYSVFKQGMGRIWAPDAVLGEFEEEGNGNPGMNIHTDMKHGYANANDLKFHYQGPVQKKLSDDGSAYLYYIETVDGQILGLGAEWANGSGWLDRETATSGRLAWSVGRLAWSVSRLDWLGGETLPAGRLAWSVGRLAWSVDYLVWSEGRLAWSVDAPVDAAGRLAWSVGRLAWSVGRFEWAGGANWMPSADAVATNGRLAWSVNVVPTTTNVTTTRWVSE